MDPRYFPSPAAGVAAYEARAPEADEPRLEERPEALPEPYAVAFRARAGATWAFFQAPSPAYRRTAIGWILAAKREETRLRGPDPRI